MSKAKRPNLLFLMTDQLRWDALGCTGGWVKTPNLDRIAEEGVLFPNCVTTSPVCIPARVSQATGLYPHNTGVWYNCRYTLPPESKTWMQAIRDAGYETSVFGKTHLHPHHGDLRDREDLIHAYGLDTVNEIGGPRASARVDSHMTEKWEKLGLWEKYQEDYAERFANRPHVTRPSVLPLEQYADVYVGQTAKQYLADYTGDEPWFCWVSFGGPHEPWDTPEPYASMYDPETMPPPAPRPEWHEDRPRGIVDERLARPPISFEPGEIARMRADYAGNVTLIDDQIGEILDLLEQRGELQNTAIVLTSDHGELNGDFGLIYKDLFLDGCLRVPMIVRTPETVASYAAGRICDSPVEWIDAGPTLVELAGGKQDYTQFAQSLIPVAHQQTERHRPDALSEINGEVMLLTSTYKIALNSDGDCYMLFDRQEDPAEQNNLAGKDCYNNLETALRLRILQRIMQSQTTQR